MTVTFEMEGNYTVQNMLKMIKHQKQIREFARKAEEDRAKRVSEKKQLN